MTLASAARGSNVTSGVEGLLLGQDNDSDAANAPKLSSSMSGNRLKNLLEGREPSTSWHSEMSSDADELALSPRATGKQRGETGGPNDCIIDLGKPKPNPRNRTPSGSTPFDAIDGRVRQFEQEAARPLPYRDQHDQPPRTRKISNMRGKVYMRAEGLAALLTRASWPDAFQYVNNQDSASAQRFIR